MIEKTRYLWVAFIPLFLSVGFGAFKFGRVIRDGFRASYTATQFTLYFAVVMFAIIWFFYFISKYDKENER